MPEKKPEKLGVEDLNDAGISLLPLLVPFAILLSYAIILGMVFCGY